MHIWRRTIGAHTVSSGADEVVAGAYLPKGGKFHSVQGELHAISNGSKSVLLIQGYGFGGEMIELDESTSSDYDEIWDEQVVKAADFTTVADTNVIDWDWLTEDVGPAIVPGQSNLNALVGMEVGSKEIIPPRMEWLSWAKSRQGGWEVGTPDTYNASDFKTFRSNRKLVADRPSALMLAFSAPALDEVRLITADKTPANLGEWWMLSNMRETLRDMGKMQAGISETGAESPMVDASQVIADLVAPDMSDPSTSLFAPTTWTVFCTATWHLELPGDSLPNTLDAR